MSGKRRNIDSDFEAKNHQLQFHGSLNRAAAKGRGRQMFRSPIPKIFSSVCARWTRISRGVTGSALVSSMEGLKSPDRSRVFLTKTAKGQFVSKNSNLSPAPRRSHRALPPID